MRLSREKINKLARVILDAYKQADTLEFVEDPDAIRQEARKVLEDLLREELKVDQAARKMIENHKRTIPEGSQEWDILYRKYYNEEVKKLGI